MEEDLEFWECWNKCKAIFEGMEKSLITAKQKNPSVDYTEQDKKIQWMADIQLFLGKIQEENTVLKRVNLEHGERYGKLKYLFLDEVNKNKVLETELTTLKNSTNPNF